MEVHRGNADSRPKSGRHIVRFALAALTLAGVLFVPAVAPAGAANKTLGGQLHCSGLNKVESIWFLGSKSGWHGKDVPKAERSYKMTYSFTAVKGETIKAWIDCTNSAERYSTFTVGSGSTRHICDWGPPQVCTSTSLAGCVLKSVLGTKISLVGCIRYI